MKQPSETTPRSRLRSRWSGGRNHSALHAASGIQAVNAPATSNTRRWPAQR